MKVLKCFYIHVWLMVNWLIWTSYSAKLDSSLLHLDVSKDEAPILLKEFPQDELDILKETFNSFMKRFRKEYIDEQEHRYRLVVFIQNWIRIQHWNSRLSSNHSSVYGVTQFSDMTPKEFETQVLRRKPSRGSSSFHQTANGKVSNGVTRLEGYSNSPLDDLIEKIKEKSKETIQHIIDKISGHSGDDDDDGGEPNPIPDNGKVANLSSCAARLRYPEHCESWKSVDWRQKGAVTEVKYQGTCGSCWSFGATSDLEGAWYLAGHRRVSLSEQQLISCDEEDLGCEGGLQQNAFDYIKLAGGVMSERDYPYVSENSSRPMCPLNLGLFAATLDDWVQVSDAEHVKRTEEEIARYVLRNGPVTIGINALPMQFYIGGVHDPFFFECPGSELNHAVTIVGFDIDGPIPYWIIKNSWGTMWGESGYYRLIMGKNACGVANDVVHSIVTPLGNPEMEDDIPFPEKYLRDPVEKLLIQQQQH